MDFHFSACLLFPYILFPGAEEWEGGPVHHGSCIEVREQALGMCSFLLLRGFPEPAQVLGLGPSAKSSQPLKVGLYFSTSYIYPRDLQGNNKIESPFPSQTHHNDTQVSHDERTTSAQEYRCLSGPSNGNSQSQAELLKSH